MPCCWEISEAASRTYSFQALLPGVRPGRTPNTTTIALIARAAKRGVPRARLGGHGVFPATQNGPPRRADKSLIFSTCTVALGVPFPMSQDIQETGRPP
jgi:hypothetical protein